MLQLAELPYPVPEDCELSIDVKSAGVGFVDTLFRAGVAGFEVGQPVAALLSSSRP